MKDFDFNQGGALLDEIEGLGGGIGEIDDSVGLRRAVVFYGHANGLAVSEIGDAQSCTASERWVSGGEFGRRVDPATGGFMAFER